MQPSAARLNMAEPGKYLRNTHACSGAWIGDHRLVTNTNPSCHVLHSCKERLRPANCRSHIILLKLQHAVWKLGSSSSNCKMQMQQQSSDAAKSPQLRLPSSPAKQSLSIHGSPKILKALAGQLGAAGQSPRSSPAASSPRVKLTVAQYQSASAEALQSEVQHVQHALCDCQAAYSKALADVNKSTARIQQLEQQVK